jgi:hypothetical protein
MHVWHIMQFSMLWELHDMPMLSEQHTDDTLQLARQKLSLY